MSVTAVRQRAAVAHISYKPGWKFRVGGPLNQYLCIFATTPDSNRPTVERTTQHMFQLPDLEGREFYRWVYDRLLDCERHETGEFFRVNGQAPFMPHHQDVGSPYVHVEREIAWP